MYAQPFDRRGLPARAAPFLLAIAAAFALTPLQPNPAWSRELALAGAITALIVACGVVVPWSRLPRFAQTLPPLAFFVVIMLLNESQGSATSVYAAPLVMLPVIWLALYGTQFELALGIAGVAVTLVVPPYLVGDPNFGPAEWRSILLWVLVAPLGGLTAQALVRKLRERTVELERRAAELERSEEEARLAVVSMAAVGDVTRGVARATDVDAARAAIASASCEVSGAAFACVLEAENADQLAQTAAEGLSADATLEVLVGDEPSAAAAALVARQPFFVPDVRERQAVPEAFADSTGAVSMHFEPIVGESGAVGVLALGWRVQRESLSGPIASGVRALAAEAAVAFERAKLLERLTAFARTDDLTGLPNRRAWEEQLPRELARARREGQSVCVVMLDLDRFKAFNDREGHQAGDRMLKLCAAAWSNQLRATDVLARYGGEEFSLMLSGCAMRDARALVERLRETTPEQQTLSAGIAAWDGAELSAELVGRADTALYEAKRAGRNRVVSAPSS
jgi:diguanylate cyclase (GGDEF)-like protein